MVSEKGLPRSWRSPWWKDATEERGDNEHSAAKFLRDQVAYEVRQPGG